MRILNLSNCVPVLFFVLLAGIPVFGQRTELMYLSGTDKDNTVEWDFYIDNGMNSGVWTTIAVPSNWETEGFGVYKYGRGDRGKKPLSDETATYRYDFAVPRAWKGHQVSIVFEGVMTDTYVEVNGRPAGPLHQGGFYEFEYDISGLLEYGKENALTVVVKNWSGNESVNKAEREADYWIFGGIYRPVYLKAKPRQHIDRLAIDARMGGEFKVDVYLGDNRNLVRAETRIYNSKGQRVGDPIYAPIERGQDKLTMASYFRPVKPWSPEFPDLYTAEVTIFDKKSIAHSVTQQFGFRTVELREGEGFFVNGVKVVFKGINRHSFWPESGRCTSKTISIMDVQLMKEMNMNAVRMSHYPPDRHFLEVCDSLGLFVLDELAGWQDAYDTGAGEKLVRELVVRDVNHPCIVAWDNGNEGGNNHELVDDFHIWDPQKRPVIHPWAIFRGTDTNHYKDYNCCPGMLFHGAEVFFPTEFLHGLYDGGHGAGLDDYWKLMRTKNLGAGGFLWVFADEGVVRVDQDGRIDTHGSDAPDGIVGPYRQKEGSFYAVRAVWSPIYIERSMLGQGFAGQLEVENRYLYTNLDQCSLEWRLVHYPLPQHSATDPDVAVKKKMQLPSTAPGRTVTVDLGLPNGFRQYDGLHVRCIDPHGSTVYEYSWPLRSPGGLTGKVVQQEHEGEVAVHETQDTLAVSASGITFTFSKSEGTLTQVENSGRTISFGGGPVLAAGDAAFNGLEHREVEQGHKIELHYEGAVKHASFIVHPDGLLSLDYAYLPEKGHYEYLGINFHYPEDKVKGIKWLGRGPYRVWKNRRQGMAFGVWQKAYNNTITGETEWIYPEFKGYHAQLYWMTLDNEEHPFTIYCTSPDVYMRLYTPGEPQGAYNDNTDGTFPTGDISFMHAISPIGTKFKEAQQLGPQGRQNIVQYHRRHSMSYTCNLLFDFR